MQAHLGEPGSKPAVVQIVVHVWRTASCVFASCSSALEAILDAICMGKRKRTSHLRSKPAHLLIMTALAPHMDKTKFVRWKVKGSDLPLRWDDALRGGDNP